MKEKLRITSPAVEMDIINQGYTLGQLIRSTRCFGFDLWPKTASQAERQCRQCLRVCCCCSSQQLIFPSRHLCFLSIHCGGANDSIIRYYCLSFLTHHSTSLYWVVLCLFTSVYLSQNYKLRGGQNFIWAGDAVRWEAGDLRAIYATTFHCHLSDVLPTSNA